MEILHLTLKKKWFDLIKSGEKKEEYREIKPYWITRLTCGTGFHTNDTPSQHRPLVYVWRHFDAVIAKNGYSGGAPLVSWKHKGIRIGKPNPAWCEPEDADKTVFILEIGELLK